MASRVKCYSYVFRQSQCVICPSLQLELEQMKTKTEKLEKERNDYKQHMDKLENRVSCQTFYLNRTKKKLLLSLIVNTRD